MINDNLFESRYLQIHKITCGPYSYLNFRRNLRKSFISGWIAEREGGEGRNDECCQTTPGMCKGVQQQTPAIGAGHFSQFIVISFSPTIRHSKDFSKRAILSRMEF